MPDVAPASIAWRAWSSQHVDRYGPLAREAFIAGYEAAAQPHVWFLYDHHDLLEVFATETDAHVRARYLVSIAEPDSSHACTERCFEISRATVLREVPR